MISHFRMVFVGIIIVVIILFFCPAKNRKMKNKKNRRKNAKKEITDDITPVNVFLHALLQSPKSETKNNIYMKFVYDDVDKFLTWKYGGNDRISNIIYNLILLPYKNNQNVFKIHFNDSKYLTEIYKKYNLYNDFLQESLSDVIFITSNYNTNKEQFLELVPLSNGEYGIKASIMSNHGPLAFLHIDNKKLYFDSGMHHNLAKFTIV